MAEGAPAGTDSPHHIRTEPDALFWTLRGLVDCHASIDMCERLLRVHAARGHVFLVIDARAFTSLDAEARRKNAEWHRTHTIDLEVVIFGTSLLTRTVLTLFSNGVRLFGHPSLNVSFVATEAEALAWLAERRAARAPQDGRGGAA